VAGVAVSVSTVLAGKVREQPVAAVDPLVMVQLIRGVSVAWLLTVPLPPPGVLVILTLNGPLRNVALTVRLAFILIVQVPVPVHGKPQPPKACPLAGLAVSVTLAP
jgi:hypothetical protein